MVSFFSNIIDAFTNNLLAEDRYQMILGGLQVTLLITFCAAVMDMTRASDLIRSRTFDAFFPLIVTAAIYFLVAWLIGMNQTALVKTNVHHRHRPY